MGDYASASTLGHQGDVCLTVRQREVLRLVASGATAEEIAEELAISPRTVRAHTERLRVKLGVSRTRTIPIAYRRATGLDPISGEPLA